MKSIFFIFFYIALFACLSRRVRASLQDMDEVSLIIQNVKFPYIHLVNMIANNDSFNIHCFFN